MPVIRKNGEEVNPLLLNPKTQPQITSPQVEADEFSKYERDVFRYDLALGFIALVVVIALSALLGLAQVINNHFQQKRVEVAPVNFDPCAGTAKYNDGKGNIICAPNGQHLGRGVQSTWEVQK